MAVSATYRDHPTDARETFAAAVAEGRRQLHESVVVHTCHRVEVFAVTDEDPPWPGAFGATVLRDQDAAERAFLVAGGLESAVLAEEQLLGQVKSAYEAALRAGQTGPILNELYRRAIRFGKQVRSEVRPTADRSLAHRAIGWVDERLGPARRGRERSALVLGSGEMGRLLARLLAERGLCVTVGSRSLERAGRVMASLPHPARHRAALVDDALGTASGMDVVAIAVRSAAMPLEGGHLGTGAELPLVVDLSAPAAVTPEAEALLGHRLLDLDRLGKLASAPSLRPSAERRLRSAAEAGAAEFMDWWARRPSRDGVALLRAHAAQIRERHLERIRRRNDMSAEQVAAVEAATAAMLGELLHFPTVRLQREPDAREVVARLFGIES